MQTQSMRIPSSPDLVESYWVLPDQFLAGEYPADIREDDAYARLDSLLAAGVTTFVNLTTPGELPEYASVLRQRAARLGVEISHQCFPILDLGLPSPAHMQGILDFIDQALERRHKLYVHCWGGVGRTGLTVGCYLVRHGRTGEQALDQIAAWWLSMPKRQYSPRSPETDEQVAFVLNWHEGAHTSST